MVAYREPELAPGQIKVSMRSVGDHDVSALCKALGGGGHRNAASCVVSEETFEAWKSAAAAQ